MENLDSVERQYWYHGYFAGRMDERKALRAKRLRVRALRWLRRLRRA